MVKKGRRVLVGKIDLDTVGAALLLGVSRDDKVEVLRGQASSEDLANADIVCIEVGGSGQSQLNNWDHHGPAGTTSYSSATLQVWQSLGSSFEAPCFCCASPWALRELVCYIDQLDTQGPQALGPREVGFPTLSDVFAGMLLTERNPVEQLHLGVKILQDVVVAGINAFGSMPKSMVQEPWAAYAKAKAENNRQIAKAVEQAQWGKTSSGLKLAWLETDFFGAPGALYGVGAQVVVAFSPHFGPAGVPKFTVAGNSVRVDSVLPELNAREPGWGGPPTGTIIGSPREGSKLTLDEVAEIVRKGL